MFPESEALRTGLEEWVVVRGKRKREDNSCLGNSTRQSPEAGKHEVYLGPNNQVYPGVLNVCMHVCA